MPDESTEEEPRNFFLGPDELTKSLDYSKKLSAPYIPETADTTESAEPALPPAQAKAAPTHNTESQEASSSSSSSSSYTPILPIERGDTTLPPLEPTASTNHFTRSQSTTTTPTPEQLLTIHGNVHKTATRALTLISSLSNGSSSDLTRHNIQRCISTFGRHNTDTALPPRPTSIYNTQPLPPKLRAGPDTGSSEVQIAILTAKINVLADNLYKKDKLNKRNLRLMVHKRQKLLAYLQRRERGGPRWRNLVEGLGIQDAMWRGEISL